MINALDSTHGPNENIRLEHFRGHMRYVAAIVHSLGAEDSRSY